MANLRGIPGMGLLGALTGSVPGAGLIPGVGGGIVPEALGLDPLDPVNSGIDRLNESGHPDIAKLISMIQQIAGTALGG